MPIRRLAHKKLSIGMKPKAPLVTLADSPIPPETDFSALSALFMGDRKIGKTSFCAQYDDPYFFMFEHGAKFLRIRQSQCFDWNSTLKVVEALERKPKGYAKNFVLDTGFKMYEHCFRWTVEDLGLTDIRDEGWGNGWTKVNQNFLEVNERILALGGGYIATCHTETSEMRSNNTVLFKTKAELSKQAYRWFLSFVDIIAYYGYDQAGKRFIQIRGNSEVEVGSRPPENFLYPDGTPIIKIPAGESPKEAFLNFKKAFHNELPKPIVKSKPMLNVKKKLGGSMSK
jgi:AAA domain